MNEAKVPGVVKPTDTRSIPPDKPIVVPDIRPRSRHSAITKDLYTYQRYKTWMHNLRDPWEKK
jgi:hypothetical protein